MFDELMSKAAELRARGQIFAFAVVVRCDPPISGKPGDKAIIDAQGKISGWIGGGCSQPLVIKEALKAIADGSPRLVRISPGATGSAKGGVVDYTMTCHSGGSLDIYIEPIFSKPHIAIFGRSAVAFALARLGKAIGFEISICAPGIKPEDCPEADLVFDDLDADPQHVTPRTFVVVATQGEHDEQALEKATGTNAPYIAFVASKQKTQAVMQTLKQQGLAAERLRRVVAPAGLPIGAVLPEEIAVSILAQVVEVSRNRSKPASLLPPLADSGEAIDPVCGMKVNIANAKYKSDLGGGMTYFCCARCQQTFEQSPEKYAVIRLRA